MIHAAVWSYLSLYISSLLYYFQIVENKKDGFEMLKVGYVSLLLMRSWFPSEISNDIWSNYEFKMYI